MNKTRRMAIMKQRQKKKKYELRRKEAIRAGGGVTEIRRPRPARPKTVGMPLQEAVVAAKKAVVIPTTQTKFNASCEYSKIGEHLTTKKTPAVTIVAA